MKPEAKGYHNILKENVLPSFDMKGIWEAMEECYRLGLAKSIGVSNFGIKKLTQLVENATIPPAVNQVWSFSNCMGIDIYAAMMLANWYDRVISCKLL